jgi:hypothetical protein
MLMVKVAVVALVLFANQFGSLVIFPFLPFMVHDFFPNISKDQLGIFCDALLFKGFILDFLPLLSILEVFVRTLL